MNYRELSEYLRTLPSKLTNDSNGNVKVITYTTEDNKKVYKRLGYEGDNLIKVIISGSVSTDVVQTKMTLTYDEDDNLINTSYS